MGFPEKIQMLNPIIEAAKQNSPNTHKFIIDKFSDENDPILNQVLEIAFEEISKFPNPEVLNLILSENVLKLEVSMETDINMASHNNAEIVEKVVDKVLNGYDVIDCIPILIEASKHGFKNVSDKLVGEAEKDQDLFHCDDYLKVLENISKYKNASVAKKIVKIANKINKEDGFIPDLAVEVLKNVIKNHSSEEKLIDKIKKLEIEELDVIIEKELKNKKSLKM